MNKIICLIVCMMSFFLSSCGKFNQNSEHMLSGLQVSQNMSDEEVEEEAQSGQMRNIK
ncbi:MAG: hypothetical protein JSR17_00425 [Proteobacteria bacterium]|nr:hypothetical protein [Pseudomonadota bacterium]